MLKLQSAARNSCEWFEEIERYFHLDPVQFNYSLLTRSQRISHENLRLRDKAWLEGAEAWFQRKAGAPANVVRRPMFAPYSLRDLKLKNRVVVSPMDQYKAVDGCPTDWHFVHYAERAKGGAGLVYIEMTCVSPEGRITPGCTGLYAPEHEIAWKRIVDFVHAETEARICCQLGHSGGKGSTQLGWEEMDAPLQQGNWPVMSVSDVPWSPRNQVPKPMDRADMELVKRQFVLSTEMAERAGFDMLELHCAHGYLLSSFITPLTNTRTDEYGGSLENRMRYPLEVFRAVRAVWPEEKPISVRISANDWVGDKGVTPAEAVDIARIFQDAGVDILQRLGRTDDARGAAGLWPHVPDAVLRPHPQRDRHGDDGGRQHLRARPRQLDPDGGARRPRLPRPSASDRSLLDAARRGCARRPRRGVARALLARTRPALPPRRARGRRGEGVKMKFGLDAVILARAQRDARTQESVIAKSLGSRVSASLRPRMTPVGGRP